MSLSDKLTLIGIVVTAVGSVSTVLGLVFVWLQVRATQQSAKGEFLLHMAEMLYDHDAAYQCLINRVDMSQTEWQPGQAGVSELAMDNYMTLFEHMKVMIDYGILDVEVFDRFYGYRVLFIVSNTWIYDGRLTQHAAGWPDFIQLCKLVAERRRPLLTEKSTRWQRFIERVDTLVMVEPTNW